MLPGSGLGRVIGGGASEQRSADPEGRIADFALAVESWAMARALVTGGSRGLGYEVARGLLSHNIEITILGRDEERVARAANSLGVEGICCDVRDYQNLKSVNDAHEPFDILVLSHGVMSEKMSKNFESFAGGLAPDNRYQSLWSV